MLKYTWTNRSLLKFLEITSFPLRLSKFTSSIQYVIRDKNPAVFFKIQRENLSKLFFPLYSFLHGNLIRLYPLESKIRKP